MLAWRTVGRTHAAVGAELRRAVAVAKRVGELVTGARSCRSKIAPQPEVRSALEFRLLRRCTTASMRTVYDRCTTRT